jgi:hypothetical protein
LLSAMTDTALTNAKPAPGLAKRARRFLLGVGLLATATVAAIRYVPTSTYEGQVQRVYEKSLEYRVEFVTDDGEVRVFNNMEQRFPYLKFDTADLQANLQRFQREGDTVRIKVWGIRSAVLSSFPNVVDVERVRAGSSLRQARNARVTSAVLAELRAMQLVPAGREAEVEQRMSRAVEVASQALPGGEAP